MSDPASIELARCVVRIHCRHSAARPAARSESSADSQPLPRSRPESPATRESTYNRGAIPPVLPCWLHIKREHHPILDGEVGSFSLSRPPSRPPTQQRSAQAAGYYLKSLYSNRRTA